MQNAKRAMQRVTEYYFAVHHTKHGGLFLCNKIKLSKNDKKLSINEKDVAKIHLNRLLWLW